MRLYGMYVICKKYIKAVQEMKVGTKSTGGNSVRFIEHWKQKSILINELSKIPSLQENTRKLYDAIPAVYRDVDQFEITQSTATNFITEREKLIVAMQTIITLYESMNLNFSTECTGGFDISLPKFSDIGEFSKCLEDLDFIIKQCPYFKQKDGQIKYGTVDVGSTWLTFLVGGSAAMAILSALGKLVDVAIKMKSHAVTVKMQEEQLREMQLKSETLSQVVDAFKQVNSAITKGYVNEVEQELGELADGEEEYKVGRSLEKLAYWMDKGMQIYSAIDAPDEIKDLFPVQEEMSFLTDDLQRLIEMKK